MPTTGSGLNRPGPVAPVRTKIALQLAMIRLRKASVAIATLAVLDVGALGCQTVYSIGQPPIWRQQLTAQGTAYSQGDRSGATLSYGVFHSLTKPPIQALNPVIGLIGGTFEGYGTIGGGSTADAGVRAMATSRLLATSVGADWDMRSGRINTVLSWQTAIRRGGLFGHGSMLRVDWIPAREQTVRVGLTAPIFDPLAGRTRPRATTVEIPRPPQPRALVSPKRDAATQRLAVQIESASNVIAAYSDLWTDAAIRASRASSYREAMERSRVAVEELFGAAVEQQIPRFARNDSVGFARNDMARRARAAVLERIIIPVDSVFGRAKRVNIAVLAGGATADFERWLADSSGLSAAAQASAMSAFASWVAAVTTPMRDIVQRNGDSRLIWLPMDLALTLDQYDDQIEVDSLIGRVVGHPFTDHNALTYMRNTDLPLEVARSILAARQYHVIWTHEFMGREWFTRKIDDIGYTMVADAYYPALTAAVRRYDSTGVFPMYMILHDQYFYEISDGRLWLTILEDPLHASLSMKGDDGTREAHLRQRQNELRAAVASSRRLQQDARASGDAEHWLRETVKVHVNVGQPSDFSFRSSHIIPGIPFAPDNLMRDHRKLVLYDVNEAEPNRGAVFVMGIGIGELYANASWEDRGFRLSGPATLEARAALRQALQSNGYAEREIPAPLRAVASKRAQEQQANQGAFVGRALQVHNQVGFGDKKSSVARAMLYNLAQPGAVIVAPDQLWMSETWGGMLAGAAARGARVQIIAPAQANAPIPDAPAMARAHDVLLRMLALRDSLTPTMRECGGDLRIGLYAAKAQADDAAGRLREVREGLTKNPWIREVIPFDDKTLAVLGQVEHQIVSDRDATAIAKDPKARPPQPHRKTQVVARPDAIAALLRQPGWDVMLADAMRVQSRQTSTFAEQLGAPQPAVDTAATRRADEMMRGYEASIPAAERKHVSFYFAEGSHNMDQRGLMSDGEATLIVSGPQASAGLADLFFMMARTTWIETPAELQQLLPRRASIIHRFAKWVRATL